jgi:hypothetical protein
MRARRHQREGQGLTEWVEAFWRLGVLHGLDIRPEGSGRESPVKPRLWQESHVHGVSARVGARTLCAPPYSGVWLEGRRCMRLLTTSVHELRTRTRR